MYLPCLSSEYGSPKWLKSKSVNSYHQDTLVFDIRMSLRVILVGSNETLHKVSYSRSRTKVKGFAVSCVTRNDGRL